MRSPANIKFSIEPLAKHHDLDLEEARVRDRFSCSNGQLDGYLKLRASQDKKKNIAIPYIVIDLENRQIIGYYTLSMTSIDIGELPSSIAKKLLKYPLIGVTLIGRLAVDTNYRGMGWGKLLMMDALYRSLQTSKQVASFAVIVLKDTASHIEAIDRQAAEFYQRFDFQPFPEQPLKLFRTMKNIEQTFQ